MKNKKSIHRKPKSPPKKDRTLSMFCYTCGEMMAVTDSGMRCLKCHPEVLPPAPVIAENALTIEHPCPDCGQELHKESGRCWVCSHCGYSSCPIA